MDLGSHSGKAKTDELKAIADAMFVLGSGVFEDGFETAFIGRD
jgi:hypothetical protein